MSDIEIVGRRFALDIDIPISEYIGEIGESRESQQEEQEEAHGFDTVSPQLEEPNVCDTDLLRQVQQQATEQQQPTQEHNRNDDCEHETYDTLMRLWDDGPTKAEQVLFTSTEESESDSEYVRAREAATKKRQRKISRTMSQQIAQSNTSTTQLGPPTLDAITDSEYLRQIIVDSQTKTAKHELAQRIIWDKFGEYSGHTIIGAVFDVLFGVLHGYIGICSEPIERFA